MYCIKCGNQMDEGSESCKVCGYEINGKRKKGNKNTLIHTLIRYVIEYIIIAVFYFLIANTKLLEEIGGLIIIVVLGIVYCVLSSILNIRIKLKEFGDYFFSNIISIILCGGSSFISLYIYLKTNNLYAESAFGYFMCWLISCVFVIPCLFIANIIIDERTTIKKNKQ